MCLVLAHRPGGTDLFHATAGSRQVKKSVRAALREEVMLEVRSQMHESQPTPATRLW